MYAIAPDRLEAVRVKAYAAYASLTEATGHMCYAMPQRHDYQTEDEWNAATREFARLYGMMLELCRHYRTLATTNGNRP